jgi:hypothetical protein
MVRLFGIALALALLSASAYLVATHGVARAGGIGSPAAQYAGYIKVENMTLATGDIIYAQTWSGLNCGSAAIYANSGSNTSGFFFITIESEDTKPGCFEGGEPIVFKFKGVKAQEIPSWSNWGGQVVDLSFKATRYQQCTPQLCPLSATPVFILPPASR